MAALTQSRMSQPQSITYIQLPLDAGQTAVYKGGRACGDTTTGTVKKAAAGNANLLSLGEFAEDITAPVAPQLVNVRLDKEIWAYWYDNATGGNAITTAMLFQEIAYWLDDHTVTAASSGNSVAGRIWAVDSVKGVLIEATGTGAQL